MYEAGTRHIHESPFGTYRSSCTPHACHTNSPNLYYQLSFESAAAHTMDVQYALGMHATFRMGVGGCCHRVPNTYPAHQSAHGAWPPPCQHGLSCRHNNVRNDTLTVSNFIHSPFCQIRQTDLRTSSREFPFPISMISYTDGSVQFADMAVDGALPTKLELYYCVPMGAQCLVARSENAAAKCVISAATLVSP